MAQSPATVPAQAAATSRPAASQPVPTDAAGLLKLAHAELLANRNVSAQKYAADGVAINGRTIPQKIEDDTRANLYQVLAVSHLRLSEYAKARAAMDRVKTSPNSNRTVQLNDALIDLQIRNFVIRGAETIGKLLAQGPVDEATVNLFGYAIAKAETDASVRARIPKLWQDYASFEMQLAPPGPRRMHWGSRWLTTDETIEMKWQLRKVEEERSDRLGEISRLEDQILNQRRIVNDANADYQAQRLRDARTANPSAVNRENNELARLNILYDKAVQAAQVPIPGPKPIFAPPPARGYDPDLTLVAR